MILWAAGMGQASPVLANSRAKLAVVSCAELLERNAPHLGDLLGGMAHEARFVGLAAMRDRRQIRRISFNQVAVGRDELGDVADFLGVAEGDDAGKRDIAAQVERCAGQVGAGGEAVQQEREMRPARLPP